jgi:hypothetical protein
MKKAAEQRNTRYHAYLRRLRAGGRSNMYGAIPYLMSAFALDRDSAYRIVCEWVDQQTAASQDASAAASPAVLGRRRRARGRAA